MSTLVERDLSSETWTKLKARYVARRQRMLEQLAGDMDERKTAKLRGRIAECDLFLALEKQEPEPEREDFSTDGF